VILEVPLVPAPCTRVEAGSVEVLLDGLGQRGLRVWMTALVNLVDQPDASLFSFLLCVRAWRNPLCQVVALLTD
jgi:hypothetical protein